MRITILGATGLLGKALMSEWKGDEISGFGSGEVDIRNPQEIANIIESARPEWTILAAAYTDVDGCEANRDLAMAVNYRGAMHVAEAVRKLGSRLLFLSTDYVFDGTKSTPYEVDDRRAPLNVYGQTKAEAENAVAEILPDCCIVRTSLLFGHGGKCFPDTILNFAATRSEMDVVDDQRGSPTNVLDLARTIQKLCEKNATGLVHVTNRGDCTWYEFANEIIAKAKLNPLVRPTTSEKFVRPAKRPKYGVLSPRSLAEYDVSMPTWQDGLSRYMEQREKI